MRLILLIVLSLLSNLNIEASESCPVSPNLKNLKCSGQFIAYNKNDLLFYLNSLKDLKSNKAKNLIIHFDLNSNDISNIVSPCQIDFATNSKVKFENNMCIHGEKGIQFQFGNTLEAKDLTIEANDEIIFKNQNKITASNLLINSFGILKNSRVIIGDDLNITTNNLHIYSYDDSKIGRRNTIKSSEQFGMYTQGNADDFIGQDTIIEADDLEISATADLKLQSKIKLKATDITLNANKCYIFNKSIEFITVNKLGNCFLLSDKKSSFIVDKNHGKIPLSVKFTAKEFKNLNEYKWYFGDGESLTTISNTVTHIYSRAGLYTARMKYSDTQNKKGTFIFKDGGSVDMNARQNNQIPPIANLQCITNNSLVNCNALGSYDPSGFNLRYEFDFGDGHIENNETGLATHAYHKAGTFEVKLTITNGVNKSAVDKVIVMPVNPVNSLPTGELDCIALDSPKTIKCTADQMTDSDGEIISFSYVFDDGSSRSITNGNSFTYTFANSGEHTIQLTVTDNDGGQSTFSKSLITKVNNNPIVEMNCAISMPQEINCWVTPIDTDISDYPSYIKWSILKEGIVEYSTEGNINFNIIQTLNHAGEVDVRVQVFDQFGGMGEKTTRIKLIENKPPSININCIFTNSSTYQCNATPIDPDGTVVAHSYKIDNEIVGVTPDLIYTFPVGGIHHLIYEATDNLGAKSTFEQDIDVKIINAHFSCEEIEPMKISCIADKLIPVDANDPIISTIYTFDDRDLLPGPNIEYEFYTFGDHKIKLMAKSKSGEMITLEQKITFQEKYLEPRSVFVEEVQLNKTLLFDGSLSMLTGRKVAKYDWDFGDGNKLSTTEAVVSHPFNNLGWYDVSLTVTDLQNKTNTYKVSIYVYDPEVEAPNENSYKTIEGTDSDNDGIRDDLQRWINKNSYDSSAAKNAFKIMANAYKLQAANPKDENIILQQELIKREAAKCVDYEILPNNDTPKSREMEFMYLNTNERYLNFSTVKEITSKLPNSDETTGTTDLCAKWRN